MNTKTIIGGIAGGIIFFLLGYAVYVMALGGFYESNFNDCMSRGDDLIMWAAVAFNLVWGFFFALLIQWKGADNFMDALKLGALVGFLISLGMTLQFHSMTTMFTTGLSGLGMAVAIDTVFQGVSVGILGFVMSKF